MAERCGAKTRKGTPCAQQAGWGTQHVGVGRCKLHGGSEPHAQVNGMVLLARREQAVMGMPLSIEPHEAILECIRIAAGEVRYASDRIAELSLEEAVGPVITSTVHLEAATVGGNEENSSESEPPEPTAEIRYGPPAIHVWISVRRQATDRLVSYSVAAMRAGVEERLVKVAEQQGMLLAQAIQGILRELGVENRPEVGAVVRKHLELIAGAAT